MKTKEQAKSEVECLVNRFEEHKEEYRQSNYLETPARRDFIDPFFSALGWDIDNKSSISEAYRSVIHEDRVRVEGILKSPDYAFRLNGKKYFFVEAKKPHINIRDDVDSAYQLRRYAWSAKLRVSIVTNFEEFAIYDCGNKPERNDKASVSRMDYFTYKDYLRKFDFIWASFSREGVANGSFDKYICADVKKGTTEVDEAFLKSLDQWRTTLAGDIFSKNSKISEDHLNQVVQHTIDRIIFLRIAEDRNIESYGNIKNCLLEGNIYKALINIFDSAHDKYNSGLFDFKKDKVSKSIEISNSCLTEIITNLYFPNSPFEFSVLPVEILGSAYEQFLGKTIRINENKIKIEQKPEFVKAGGVFYTPQHIVEYIVKNTVGKIIENKSPEEIEKIRILDPASGSGSFLLGAYDFLLKHHIEWYSKNFTESRGRRDDPINPDGSLSTEIKKKILLNNIFGVDIDVNAVEVTKLSLLLKCLEGETSASLDRLKLCHERVLPTLDDNIKSGNSLVDTIFFEMETDFSILNRVKPFNWQSQFPEVFRRGGFDAVIGNPPYVIIFDVKIKDHLEDKFPEFARNNDFYVAFMALGVKLLSENGYFSFIVPNTFLTGEYFIGVRKLFSNLKINEILNFGIQKIFRSANVFTTIFNIQKAEPKEFFDFKNAIDGDVVSVSNDPNGYLPTNELLIKLGKNKKLDDYFVIKDVGYNYWSKGRGKIRGNSIGSRVLYSGKRANVKDIPYIKGSNISKYKITQPINFLRHDYKKYLKPNDTFRFSAEIMQRTPKIVYRQTSSAIIAALDGNAYHNDKTVHIIVMRDNISISFYYLLGILNSKLTSYFYKKITDETGRAFAQVKIVNVKKLPFIYDSNKAAHDRIVLYVTKLLELNESEELNPAQIIHFENQVDKAVYELYGLSADEIKIIEEVANGNG